ncbi:sodium-dependent glucose transporter 1 isoform X2 [Phyllopteryx taeniolatus]|uniref:sodium-dependent glucose transporter 1 isoform X2 n=1 Tax=Phyllopteryx taeniolatus TaxID=161469 RepID=UPI002AD48AD7|nr:sodium-dependent glucose transporter 1 isoform X2 [Phyllopteryx taeniolatus]
MSALSSPAAAVKKKHVRFASMDDEQEEDTLFDKRKDAERGGPRSALKAAKRTTKAGCSDRVQVVGGGGRGGGHAACGRWMVSLTLCASFLGLGMGISVIGPTFEDLALNVKKNISNISYIFVGRSAGYMGGSLIGGVLFDCMNPNLLLGGNVLILNTWGERAGPHIQALHFSFAAGAFVSPVIAKLLFGHNANGSYGAETSANNATYPVANDDRTAVRSIHSSDSNLRSMWAYIVIGSFVLLTAVPFFFLSVRGDVSRDNWRTSSAKPPVARHHRVLVVLLFFFFFAYVGAEVAYGSFIFTFAKDYAQMSQSQAAGLNSFFWATFAACRGLAIFFASCMYPGTMILLSLVGTTLSALFLCLFSKDKVMLWVCTGLYGASMSSTFPTGISWLEQYTTVTGRSAATFVVGAALGEMVLPALVGFLLGKIHGHPLLMYLSLITATFTAILFPVMYKLASVSVGQIRKRRGRGQADADDSEYRQALLDSGAIDEEDEADQWNDADFEGIEMDDTASLISSPSKEGCPPNIDGDSGLAPPSTQLSEPAKCSSSSDGISLVGDSPKRKLLLFPDRVKRD